MQINWFSSLQPFPRTEMTIAAIILSGEKAGVVVTSSEGLRWANLGGGEYREPARQAALPGLVVGLASNGTLYWVPRCCGSIYR